MPKFNRKLTNRKRITNQSTAMIHQIRTVSSFDTAACAALYPEEWKKLSKAAEIHGYCGISRGGKDGIYSILKESKRRNIGGDTKLFQVYQKLRNSRGENLVDGGIPIKVVAHVPTGERIVGVHYPKENTTVLLGLGDYNGNILI